MLGRMILQVAQDAGGSGYSLVFDTVQGSASINLRIYKYYGKHGRA
jgi:hypothetical protein